MPIKNFISREQALEVVKDYPALHRAMSALFSFPAPNPEMKDGRNALGQTEEQFWDGVERQDVEHGRR